MRPECGRAFAEVLNSSRTVFDRVFSSASPASILRYSRTCCAGREAVLSYCRRAFDIDRHLTRFFSNPKKFRSLQARTGALVSGSFALQFFDRTLYPESDLDLYVDWKCSHEVGHWLLLEGYEYRPMERDRQVSLDVALREQHVGEPQPPVTTMLAEMTDNNPYLRGVASIFNFFKKSSDGSVETKVQMMTASLTPLEIILQFHSTVVMNIISYEKAYSLYPYANFEERRALICTTSGPHQQEAHEKYIIRGWTMLLSVSQAEKTNGASSFRAESRRIGDRFTWTIPFSLEGVELPKPRTLNVGSLLCDNLAAHTWRLRHPTADNGEKTARASFQILVSPALRHGYTIYDAGLYGTIAQLVSEAGKFRREQIAEGVIEARDQYFDAELNHLCEAYHALQECKTAFVPQGL